MAQKKPACVITMVKDDYFFLDRWVKHYGDIFGRDALYVVNHGGGERIADIAAGCSVINLPPVFGASFDMVRWRLFNGLQQGLRGYHDFAIVTDVDEYLVVDPKTGLGLDDFLAKRRGQVTARPIGLEVVHKPDQEPEAIGNGPMLGPRRHVRFSSAYCKPTVFNHEVRLARGGHYSTDPKLKVFRNLYLFHMRFVDAGLFADTYNRRAAQVTEAGADGSTISGQWRAGREKSPYDVVARFPVRQSFDFDTHIRAMEETWAPRGDDSACYGPTTDIAKELQTLPERFFGLV